MRKGLKGLSFVDSLVLFCLIVVFTLYTSVQPGGMPDRALSPTVLLDGRDAHSPSSTLFQGEGCA